MSDANSFDPHHAALLPTPEEEAKIDAIVNDPNLPRREVQWRDPGPDPFGRNWAWMHGPSPDVGDEGPGAAERNDPPG